MAQGDAGHGGLIALTFCLLAARGKGGHRARGRAAVVCRCARAGGRAELRDCGAGVHPASGTSTGSVGRGLRVWVPGMPVLKGLRAVTGGV